MQRLANFSFLFCITISCFLACQSTATQSAILTENETLLDNGDTGNERNLYLLIRGVKRKKLGLIEIILIKR